MDHPRPSFIQTAHREVHGDPAWGLPYGGTLGGASQTCLLFRTQFSLEKEGLGQTVSISHV